MKNRRKCVHFYVINVCCGCSCAYVTVFIESKPYGNENAENNELKTMLSVINTRSIIR